MIRKLLVPREASSGVDVLGWLPDNAVLGDRQLRLGGLTGVGSLGYLDRVVSVSALVEPREPRLSNKLVRSDSDGLSFYVRRGG